MSLRERKVDHGATNLTARSEKGTIIRKEFYRSWTHKLISPDVHAQPASTFDPELLNKTTATWQPVALYKRDFLTNTAASYTDPKDRPLPYEPHAKSEEQVAAEMLAQEKQLEAVETLCKTAKAHFGTTAAMMKAFNKKGDDSLSLHELNEYLKRNKIDHFISPEERKHVFDYVSGEHQGKVGVRDLLRKTEEQEFRDDDHAENMFKVRNFLKEHVEKLREERSRKEHRDPDLEHRKKKKAVPGEKSLIKKALGQRTFDLDVDHDELHETIEHLHHHEKPKDVEQRKYVRFLRHSNLNLAIIPFYDMRHEELEHLKARAARVDRSFEDPEVFGKLTELSKTRWASSLSTTNETDPETMHRKQEAIFEGRATMASRMHLSQSLPNFPTAVRPSPLAQLSDPGGGGAALPADSPTLTLQTSASEAILHHGPRSGARSLAPISPTLGRSARSLPSLHEPSSTSVASLASASSPLSMSSAAAGRKVKPRNLLPRSEGVNIDDVSASNSHYIGEMAPDEKNPSLHTTALKLRKEVFHEHDQSTASDFYSQVLDESSSAGKLKDPSKVMRVEKIDANAYMPSGKRAVLQNSPTDWSRVGVGGGAGGGASGNGEARSSAALYRTGLSQAEDDPFLTTNGKYYPPLVYRPSQPVTRDLVSESEINFRKKEFQRAERYARMKANMDVTRVRLEYEEVQKKVHELRRDHGRLEDRIRYHTAMMLNDLKGYKSQPLVRMAKKQNIHLADRMWNGNAPHHVPEDRDFTSTYNASFDSSVLRLSETLIPPPHSEPATAHT